MIADPKTSFEPHSSEQLPNSKRVYLPGQIHADVQVPMREIEVTPTKSYTGPCASMIAVGRGVILPSPARPSKGCLRCAATGF
jgi:hypothetical protein